MTFPYTLKIGGHALLLHGILEFAGIFVAFRFYLWLKKKETDVIDKHNRLLVIAGASIGAVIGARVLGSLENLPEWRASQFKLLYFLGNKTLVGGLLGGLAGVEIIKKMLCEKQNTGDIFTFPLLLGMIIGRIGCFSAGVYEETYGIPTKLPWGMDLGDGLIRHPVTLYEIVFLTLLWVLLYQLKYRHTLQQGALFKLFLMAYLVFRFLLDFIKPGWRYCVGLGSIQFACLIGLLYYYRYIFHPHLLIKPNAS